MCYIQSMDEMYLVFGITDMNPKYIIYKLFVNTLVIGNKIVS